MTRERFDGAILGLGSRSGTRVVVGLWDETPFGPVTDVMIERPDGHRVLLAPTRELADYIAATYTFDEVRIRPVRRRRAHRELGVDAGELSLAVRLAGRTPVGRLLRLVPRRLARTASWCRLIDPVARRVRPGVRTFGSARGGRREYYCALDEHTVTSLDGRLEGVDLGALAPIDPPVHFGFGSSPRTPSLVRITTFVEG